MSVGYFVIAILGCADGGSACTPVATLPTRYSSQEQCLTATAPALSEHSDFDYPTLLARCRQGHERAVGKATDTRNVREALGR